MSSNFTEVTRTWLDQVTGNLFQELKEEEKLSLSCNAEEQDYLRFNRSKLRQNTFVEQRILDFLFLYKGREVTFKLAASGDTDRDTKTLIELLARARTESEILPPNPFAADLKRFGDSQQSFQSQIPATAEALSEICEICKDVDMAGFFSSGPLIRASYNSLGQKHWFDTRNFFFDYSLFTVNSEGQNKAVKGVFAEKVWNQEMLNQQIETAAKELRILERPSHNLKKGKYRVYLAPAAVSEIISTLNWRGFSYSAYKQGMSPFAELFEGRQSLSPLLTLRENFNLGLVNRFNSYGEMAPAELSIVENGKLKTKLISSKTAKEYNVESNFAAESESLRSPEILPGTLKSQNIMTQLGTGVFINNLHYVNYSDLKSARLTGMTRYACFWVENGELVGPISDMRFDESLYNFWGSKLEALTEFTRMDPNVGTYFERELGGKKIPGMLINDFTFAL